jgi:hypothetical protein
MNLNVAIAHPNPLSFKKAILNNFVKNTILVLLLSSINPLFSQYNKVEQITLFGKTIDNPIKIEVLQNGDEYNFYAENRSFYPYILELKMTEIFNLDPAFVIKQFKILPGRNQILTLKVRNPEQSADFKYSYKYNIGVPSKDVDFQFPYLKPSKSFFEFNIIGELILKNNFVLPEGDTIYAMRKGLITAVPDLYHDKDRISYKESLEIMHKDGTIMVYENLNPDNLFVRPGHVAYPSQPLGIIKSNSVLEVKLYFNKGEGKLQSLDINYCNDEFSTESFSETLKKTQTTYPESIITKEMTKMELKKYKAGKINELKQGL